MVETSKYIQELKRSGLITLLCPYSNALLQRWNRSLDTIFEESASQPRSYAKVDDLRRLGMIEEIFNPAIRNLIHTIMPDANIFHCHVYEIGAQQEDPHIHKGKNLGWHRDEDCIAAFEPDDYHHLSLFVYLTDVSIESGPFEFAPHSPSEPARNGMPTLKLLGETGTTFLWNRAYRHRACPNTSDRRRRLLKLSFQNSHLPNSRINLPEFRAVAEQFSQSDSFLSVMFGGINSQNSTPATLPPVDPAPAPEILPYDPNSSLTVGKVGLFEINYLKGVIRRIKESLGVGQKQAY